MCNVEISVRLHYGIIEIAFVISVCNELDPCPGHCLEILPYKGRDRDYGRGPVEHTFLQMPVYHDSPSGKGEMLEVEQLCPRIPEIGYPRKAGGSGEFHTDYVH